MSQNWIKLDRIFCPDNNFPWMVSHASNPVALQKGGTIFRIFFSTRSAQNVSSTGWVDIDIRAPQHILAVSEFPVLEPGSPGTFDDRGVVIGSLVQTPLGLTAYYMGWHHGDHAPWKNTLGLAVWDDATQKFIKYKKNPVLGLDQNDPYTLSYPCVVQSENTLHMWYGSHLRWAANDSKDMEHVIKDAASMDGVHWQRSGRTRIPLVHEGEVGISGVSVLGKRMWYSYRGLHYRIGYAETKDGVDWQRLDEQAGISPSQNPNDWDSLDICYPHVFDCDGRLYMLYSGNGYGKAGFGLAVLEENR